MLQRRASTLGFTAAQEPLRRRADVGRGGPAYPDSTHGNCVRSPRSLTWFRGEKALRDVVQRDRELRRCIGERALQVTNPQKLRD